MNDIDHIYKIYEIESSEEKEFLVKIKLKKNNGLAETATRNIFQQVIDLETSI